jgi:hypothetical protein
LTVVATEYLVDSGTHDCDLPKYRFALEAQASLIFVLLGLDSHQSRLGLHISLSCQKGTDLRKKRRFLNIGREDFWKTA